MCLAQEQRELIVTSCVGLSTEKKLRDGVFITKLIWNQRFEALSVVLTAVLLSSVRNLVS